MIATIEEHARAAEGALGRAAMDPRVLEAMRRVPRHAFVPAGRSPTPTTTGRCRSATARPSRSPSSWR
jgi:protein-L-isoaspartate O-methyltransferase